MNSNFAVQLRTQLDTYNFVVVNEARLILALEDLGFDEISVDSVDGGFALSISGVQIAIGLGDNPVDASEDLLDRAADLFYFNTPEA